MKILNKLFGKKYTKEEALLYVHTQRCPLGRVFTQFKNDKDVVLAAVTKEGCALEYASIDLQNDKKIVLAAVNQDMDALAFASADLKKDKDIVLAAVTKHGSALQYASSELQNNKDLVQVAMSNFSLSFMYVGAELKNDKEFVLTIVTQQGFLFPYVSKTLQNDMEVVLTALYRTPDIFRTDPTLIGRPLICCSSNLTEDPAVVFLQENRRYLTDEIWPLVKKALLEKPDYFLNPEPYIQALADGMDNPYLMLAQYALSKDVIIESEPYPGLV